MGEKDVQALNLLKNDLASATLQIIDESIPFVIETDASENAVSATLNQNNLPVAFFSRMLFKSKLRHFSVEKAAYAIVGAVRKWTHFLSCGQFYLELIVRARMTTHRRRLIIRYVTQISPDCIILLK